MVSETNLIVRYAETDQMGIVHHSVYPIWFEAARTDFLKQAGISYSDMEKNGLLMPLAEMHCRFKMPAHYEDEVIVQTTIKKMTFAKIVFEYKVYRKSDYQLLADGGTIHACTNTSLKPINVAKSFPKLYKAINSLVEKESINMKIAVACDGKNVSEHFGHCEGFELFTVDSGKVSARKFYQNPGHKPGFLPNYLNDLGTNTIITGGIGGGAIDIFNEKNIEVVTGAQGDSGTAVEQYLKGQLKSTGSVCHDHEFESTCEEHNHH